MPKKGKFCGVGISDRPKWAKGTHYQKKIYYAWTSMLRRCYYTKDSCYKYYGGVGVYVCDRWLRCSNFAEDIKYLVGYASWMAEPLGSYKYALDKDIKGRPLGLTCYSPQTCCFVPSYINNMESLRRNGNPGRSALANLNRAKSEGQSCYYIDRQGVRSRDCYGYRDLSRDLFGTGDKKKQVRMWCEGKNNHYCTRGAYKGYSFYKIDEGPYPGKV